VLYYTAFNFNISLTIKHSQQNGDDWRQSIGLSTGANCKECMPNYQRACRWTHDYNNDADDDNDDGGGDDEMRMLIGMPS